MPVLAMLPTAERIAEFLTAALSDLPGVRSCAVHLGEASEQGDVPSIPGSVTVPVETSGEVYGGFVLETDDESALAPYLPFLTNLAGSVALLAENRLQRDRLEAALADVRESEERYRSLFENLTEGVALHELFLDERAAPIDYRILAVNPAFTAQTGLSAESVCGKLASEAYGSGQAPFLEQYAGATLGGEPVRFQEHFAPLGRDFDITAVRQSEGHFASLFEDVTEQRRAEAEILRLNAELEKRVVSRTAQLEATTGELEEFVYSAAHDLRAPLRAIDGFSQLVIDDAGAVLKEGDVANLQRVRAAAQRMAGLIDHLMALSVASRRDLQIKEVDVGALASSVFEELCAAEPGREVEIAVAPGMCADADEVCLRSILANLIGNAWKFTGLHETARIEVGSLRSTASAPSSCATTAPASTGRPHSISSAPSSECTRPMSTRATVSVSPLYSVSSLATAAASGPRPRSRRARPSTSRFRGRAPPAEAPSHPLFTELRTRFASHVQFSIRYPGSRGSPVMTSPCRRRSLPTVRQDLHVIGLGHGQGHRVPFVPSKTEHLGCRMVAERGTCGGKNPTISLQSDGSAYGIRTRVTAVRGRRPRPLDECATQERGCCSARRARGGSGELG